MTQKTFDFELSHLVGLIDRLDAPREVRMLLLAIARFGCSTQAQVVTDGESDGLEWLLSPTQRDLAMQVCRTKRTIRRWIRVAEQAAMSYLTVDRIDGESSTIWINWRALGEAEKQNVTPDICPGDPGHFDNVPPDKTTMSPRTFRPDTPDIRGSCPINQVKLNHSLTHSLSSGSGVNPQGAETAGKISREKSGGRIRLPELPAEVWEAGLSERRLLRLLRDWWLAHDLRGSGVDPDHLAGAVLAARQLCAGEPQPYVEAALSGGLRPHWIARGRSLRRLDQPQPYAPHGVPQ